MNTTNTNINQEYINNLYDDIIGTDMKFNTPYGEKSIIYSDFTASGRGLKKIENFISSQVLPFYANVHTTCGYLAEQSENFRTESKTIVRRCFNSDEKDSIIYTGQGTTSCVNKLIKLMRLKQYVDFYNSIKGLKENYKATIELLGENDNEINSKFLKLNRNTVDEIISEYIKLFEIYNFCYKNRWGSYDCVLCRMTFLQESQYNDHEKNEIHIANLEKCANGIKGGINNNISNNSTNDIFKTGMKNKIKSEDFIFELIEKYEIFEPVVFLSILEHNSNALPWRETGAKIIYISFETCTDSNTTTPILSNFNYKELETQLASHNSHIIKLGSFVSASNITGYYLDVDYLSVILHKTGSLAFFDYATAAPYIKANMNGSLSKEYRTKLGFNKTFTPEEEALTYKDGIFFSPHKLLGGPNTPGVLIIKQHVVRNILVPSEPGGGVVLFVRKERQIYVKNIEMREESGTPDIIGSARIGLSLLIREKIDDIWILNKEEEINNYILQKLRNIPNLFILGDSVKNTPRIPIYSFIIKFNGKILHQNFISALLNDLFGVQSRPGCSCASTYGQLCLGLNENYLEPLERITVTGSEIFRPGYVRVNFPFFYPQRFIDYIISSIEFVARYGWLFLQHYAFEIESGRYYHRNENEEKRKWLNEITYDSNNGNIILPDLVGKGLNITDEILDKYTEQAYDVLKEYKNITKHVIGKSKLNLKLLFTEIDHHRWFLLHDDLDDFIYDIDLDDVLSLKNKPTSDNGMIRELNVKFDIKKVNNNDCMVDNKTINKIIDDNVPLDNEQIDINTEIYNTSLPNVTLNEATTKKTKNTTLFPEIPAKILKLVGSACKDFDMIKEGDKILIGLSGGKDSMTLLHVLLYLKKKVPFKFYIGGVTVDPESGDYDPSSMKEYMKKLGVEYFYESDPILERAKKSLQKDSICAFCARMKRGIIYNCARREGYNTIALGQHLDDLAESFIMSSFHNGLLRTMKANYVIDQGDLKVIRPLVYCREKLFKEFTIKANIPVIQENCPACFSAPKERHRVKVLLAQQENIFPSLFSSLQKAMIPLMKGLIEDKETGKKDDIEI